MASIYQGSRSPDGCIVNVDGKPLSPRLDLRTHCDSGYEWGYSGSGPAQLALALAAHCLQDDDRALQTYQALKEKIISVLPDEWTLHQSELYYAIEMIEKEGGFVF